MVIYDGRVKQHIQPLDVCRVNQMRYKLSALLLVLGLFGLTVVGAANQTTSVKAKFEIDGKETKDKFRILLYVDGAATEPTVSDDGHFFVSALNAEKVDVRFISDKYDLLYEDIYLAKLRGTLIFGVTEHFSDEDPPCKPGQKLVSSYSLDFQPDDAEGTSLIVTVCK